MVAASPNCTHGSVAHRDGWSEAHSWLYASCRLLSMWMTNTSTAMMLLPLLHPWRQWWRKRRSGGIEEKRQFQVALLLALAATTIGGMSTIIGTPPNVLLAGFIEETYGLQIAFFDWMLIGLPLALVLLPLGWVVLARVAFHVDVPSSPRRPMSFQACVERWAS